MDLFVLYVLMALKIHLSGAVFSVTDLFCIHKNLFKLFRAEVVFMWCLLGQISAWRVLICSFYYVGF